MFRKFANPLLLVCWTVLSACTPALTPIPATEIPTLTLEPTRTPTPAETPTPEPTAIPEHPVFSPDMELPVNSDVVQNAGVWYVVDKDTGANVYRFPEGAENWQARNDVTMAGRDYEGWVVDSWQAENVVLDKELNRLRIIGPRTSSFEYNNGIWINSLHVFVQGVKMTGWEVVEVSAVNSQGVMETSRFARIDTAYFNSMNKEVRSRFAMPESNFRSDLLGPLIPYLKRLEKESNFSIALKHKFPAQGYDPEKMFDAYYGLTFPGEDHPYCATELDCRIKAGNYGVKSFTFQLISGMLQNGADFLFDPLLSNF